MLFTLHSSLYSRVGYLADLLAFELGPSFVVEMLEKGFHLIKGG